MKENFVKLEKILKISIKKKSLLSEALTHKSANQIKNNEKLEFLGDRVIGLVLAEKLYKLYPLETEGDLDKRFAKLVNRKTCYSVGWSIGIQHNVIIGDKKKKISTEDEKIIIINAEPSNHYQARFASLDKNIIAPLENEWGYITTEKVGRNRWIHLTDEGRWASEFLI